MSLYNFKISPELNLGRLQVYFLMRYLYKGDYVVVE